MEPAHLEALILQSEEPVDKISASACLICDEWRATLENPNQDAKRSFLNSGQKVEPYGTLTQFRRHLGRHMEQLALFALPKAEGDEMEDDSAGNEVSSDEEADEDVEDDLTTATAAICTRNDCSAMTVQGALFCEYRKCVSFFHLPGTSTTKVQYMKQICGLFGCRSSNKFTASMNLVFRGFRSENALNLDMANLTFRSLCCKWLSKWDK